jgi:hypothetical protein
MLARADIVDSLPLVTRRHEWRMGAASRRRGSDGSVAGEYGKDSDHAAAFSKSAEAQLVRNLILSVAEVPLAHARPVARN